LGYIVDLSGLFGAQGTAADPINRVQQVLNDELVFEVPVAEVKWVWLDAWPGGRDRSVLGPTGKKRAEERSGRWPGKFPNSPRRLSCFPCDIIYALGHRLKMSGPSSRGTRLSATSTGWPELSVKFF
jgi:hypothetical protein